MTQGRAEQFELPFIPRSEIESKVKSHSESKFKGSGSRHVHVIDIVMHLLVEISQDVCIYICHAFPCAIESVERKVGFCSRQKTKN